MPGVGKSRQSAVEGPVVSHGCSSMSGHLVNILDVALHTGFRNKLWDLGEQRFKFIKVFSLKIPSPFT